METQKILVVDDEGTIAHILKHVLEENGCDVEVAASAERGLERLREVGVAAALVDIVLPGMNGIEMLGRIKEMSYDTEVIIMTSHASVETATQAIRSGAYDYLQKPFDDLGEVWLTVRRALEKRSLTRHNRQLLDEQKLRNRELSDAVARLCSLIEAGRAMAEFRTLPELLGFFMGQVALELNVTRASLMLLDEEKGELEIVAHRGLEDFDAQKARVPVGEGIAGAVAQTGEPYLVTDVQTDPRMESGGDPDLSRSFISAPIVLSIPIKAREKVLGVINVTNRATGEPFEEKDLSYLSGLAGQAAVAIERTRHFEDLEQAYESLKSAQDEIVASERLKALGQLAAGVAHDFSNSLSVILGKSELLLNRLDNGGVDPGTIRSDLETIRKVSMQGATTIRRIQESTRIQREVPDAPIDLNNVVRDAVEMTRPKWQNESLALGREIDVRTELAEVPTISGNLYELTQVVGNLLFNAVEAMPDGGRLTFSTTCENDRAILEVRDTGLGMDADTESRLFEPFFTTKATGHGLGMSIIFGIISRHHGEISVDSKVGRGTCIRISFPGRRSQTAGSPRAQPAQAESSQANVLLVDDDEMVLKLYNEALCTGGFEVTTASRGSEAIRLLHERPFSVLVTDLAMPGMSGLEVAKAAKRADPKIKAILLSGWSVEESQKEIKEAGIDNVLIKPCTITRLLSTIREAVRPSEEASSDRPIEHAGQEKAGSPPR